MKTIAGFHLDGCPGRYNPGVSCSCTELMRDTQVQLLKKQNPKLTQALKDGKAPMEYLVYSVLEADARVHKGGADKYGIRNWLQDEILASTYVGAIMRHLKAWVEGEDQDPESGESPLTHIRACCAVVLDAEKHGTLIDDRNRVESKDQTIGE